MTFRVATIVIAISAMLLGAAQDASAQEHGRGFGGFQRGRPGFGAGFGRGFGRSDAGRGGFAPPAFTGRGFGPPPHAFSRFGYAPPPEARRFGGYPEPPVYGARAYPPAFQGPAYQRPAYQGPADGGAPVRFGGDWRQQQNEVRQAVREGRHIPLGQAIDAVRRRSPGRELDADIVPGADGRADYRLRWAANDGRRIDYLVDAATGAIVGVEGGR